jgi:hypothetical protein
MSIQCIIITRVICDIGCPVISKGPNRIGVFPHLRTETDPVSETSCFPLFLIPGRWIESENPIFLKVIHHRQNPIVTTSSLTYCHKLNLECNIQSKSEVSNLIKLFW